MDKLTNFLKDVKIELSKVNWPKKDQLIQYTLIVLGLSLAIAVFLGGIDFLLQLGLNKFIVK